MLWKLVNILEQCLAHNMYHIVLAIIVLLRLPCSQHSARDLGAVQKLQPCIIWKAEIGTMKQQQRPQRACSHGRGIDIPGLLLQDFCPRPQHATVVDCPQKTPVMLLGFFFSPVFVTLFWHPGIPDNSVNQLKLLHKSLST